MNNRIFYKSQNGLKDLSITLGNTRKNNEVINYKIGDYFYIGARLPFNNLHFVFESKNTVNVRAKVEYLSDSAWRECVEVIDGTFGFKNDGFLQWTPKKNTSWSMKDTTEIDELKSIVVYDRYWVRISFDDDFKGEKDEENSTEENEVFKDVSFFWIGNQFANDDDLGVSYSDLVLEKTRSAYIQKETWIDQHILAAEILINDLISKSIIKSASQIIDWSEFRIAAVHKAAEIIYNLFGDDFKDQSKDARIAYNEAINKPIYRVDTNANAIEDISERETTVNFFSR